MLLPADADADTVDYLGAAAHALGYVVIVNRRFTDLFGWGSAVDRSRWPGRSNAACSARR